MYCPLERLRLRFWRICKIFAFAPGAVDEMMRAIEEGCEGID
jgi:hypothetical protein